MKKLFCAVLLLVCLAGIAWSAEGKAPDGFRGIKWYTGVGDVPGLSFEDNDGDVKIYSRAGDKMSIGPASVDAILYRFLEDKLVGVVILILNDTNKAILFNSFQQLYGEPFPTDDSGSFAWEFSEADPKVMIFSETMQNQMGTFYRFVYHTEADINHMVDLQNSIEDDL